MRLRLVVPADVDAPTGGNCYDLALSDALRGGGDEVQLVRCDAPGLATALAQPWAGHTVVDGLLACPQPQAVASTRVAVVVHMPLAWETGLTRERAADLDRRERRALHAAAKVIATSRWTADYLAGHHERAGVAVAPPGVEPAAVSAGSKPPLLVHLAALTPNKNQLVVVAALSALSDLSWQARLAGPVDRDPSYTAAVRDAVCSADLGGRVEIPGVVSRDAAWAGADLALLPSQVEAFGMVVTEALARGIPAVVSAGGAAEALGYTPSGDRPGVVIPPGDTEALTGVLRRWLTDEVYRDRLRARALSRRPTLEGWDVTARRVRTALTTP